MTLDVPQSKVLELGRTPGVRYISPDALTRKSSIDTRNLKTTHQGALGLPAVWNGSSGSGGWGGSGSWGGSSTATGNGVTIAVLDTGVNPDHPALRDARVTCLSVNPRATSCRDGHGHGTHVIGMIVGRDPQGRYLARSATTSDTHVGNFVGRAGRASCAGVVL